MNRLMRVTLIAALLLLSLNSCVAQKDSTMKFDFGLAKGRDIYLWPLIKVHRAPGYNNTEIFFSLYQKKIDRINLKRHNHFFPLYFYDSNSVHVDLRMLSLYYPSLFHYRNNLSDSIKSYKALELAPGLSLLEVTKSRDGLFIKNNLLFFLWFGKNVAENKSFAVVFPLFWYFQNGQKKFNSFFPLYYSYKDTLVNNKILFPLAWRFKNNYYRSFTLAPLFSYGQSIDNNKSHAVITPLFWHFKDTNYSKQFLLPLWYKYSRTSPVKSTSFKMLFPLYWNNTKIETIRYTPFHDSIETIHTDSSSQTVVFPFYWERNQNQLHNKTIFPFYFKRKNEYYESVALFPFFSFKHGFRDSSRRYSITPLFWHYTDNTEKRIVFFPVYWHYRETHKKSNTPYRVVHNTIFPLWFSRTRYKDDTGTFRMLFPLFMQTKNWREYNSLTILPFFSQGSSKTGNKKHFAITPFYWFFTSKDDVRHIVFPLYWYHKDIHYRDTFINHTLFPLLYIRNSYDAHRVVLFPFSWYKKEYDDRHKTFYKSYTFFPIFFNHNSYEEKKTVIFPLFWYKKKYDQIHYHFYKSYTFFPLFYNHRSYWKHKVVVFPLYWYSKERLLKDKGYSTTHTFFPLFRYHDDPEKKSISVLPLFYYSLNKQNGGHTKVLFPLLWDIKKEDSHLKMLFPFYLNLKGKNFHHNYNYSYKAITPFIWKTKVDDRSKFLVFPFYSKTKFDNGNTKASVLGILWRHQRTATRKSTQIFWPLLDYTRDTNLTYAHFAPFVWYKKTSEFKYFSIQPLFFVRSTKETKWIQVLWQLYEYKASPEKKTTGILFHTVHYEKYTNGDHAFRFAYLLFADVNKNGTVEKSLFPLYYLKSDTSGNKYFNAGFAFYAKSTRKIENTNYFYREERIFWSLRIRSNYKYLKQKGVVKSRKEVR